MLVEWTAERRRETCEVTHGGEQDWRGVEGGNECHAAKSCPRTPETETQVACATHQLLPLTTHLFLQLLRLRNFVTFDLSVSQCVRPHLGAVAVLPYPPHTLIPNPALSKLNAHSRNSPRS